MTQIVKQNLSENIICLWKIKKEIKPINNYNIISCVFFIKKESDCSNPSKIPTLLKDLKSIINKINKTININTFPQFVVLL